MANLLCPVVVGRASELEALRDALSSARKGVGSVAFVTGEAGIGKSRLARELVADADAAGMVVLRGRAVPGTQDVALRPLAEALVARGDQLAADAALDAWLPALAGIVPNIASPALDSSPTVRSEAFVRALGSLSSGRGGLLVLEDLHWADPDTLAVVEQLTDAVDRVPVLCVVTVRAEEASAGRDLVRAVDRRRSALVLELGRLNDSQAAAMVHECSGGAGGVDAERVIAAAEGVPFLIEELLASPGVPETFADTVQQRLAVLDGDARAVLESAATLGRHFDWRLLSAATGLDDDVVARSLESGVGSQLVSVEGDGFRFRHALTRDAVLGSILPPRRRAIATDALAALEASTGPLAGSERELAARLAERADRPDHAGQLFLAIGLDALANGALSSAVAALTKAAALLGPGPARTEASLALVESLALVGRLDDAVQASSHLGDASSATNARARLSLARAAMVLTRWNLAAAQLDRARALLGETDASAALGAQLAVREAEYALGTGDPIAAVERARVALDRARAAGAHDVACESLLLIGRAERVTSLERAEAAFRAAADLAEANDLRVWRMRSLHELGTIDMLERGDPDVLVEARRLAGEVGALATAAVIDLELCASYSIRGQLELAVEHGTAAIDEATGLGQNAVAASAYLVLSSTYSELGQRDRTAEVRELGTALAPGDEVVAAMFIMAIDGLHALLDESRADALAAFDRGTSMLRDLPASAPASFRGLWPLLLAVEHDERAAGAIDEIDASGVGVNRLNLGYLQYARAVEAGRTDAAAAVALVDDGDGHLVHGPYWMHLGRRLVAEAATADAWGTPGAWAAEAAAFFASRDPDLPITAACQRIARGEAAKGWPLADLGVTRREADVLALVRGGLGNREIADQLYLSPRTVEKHVESLLRKSGARSRTELAARAAAAERGTT